MKKYRYTFLLFLSHIFLTSFAVKPKPHLIVGNWQLIEKQLNQPLFVRDGIGHSLARIYFSSDEITSGFALIMKGKKVEENFPLGFKVYEPFDDFKNPVLLFKNLCDGKTRIVFSILKLDKEILKLKFEKSFSSENISIDSEVLDFERTAGPPENMPDSKDAIKFKIGNDEK